MVFFQWVAVFEIINIAIQYLISTHSFGICPRLHTKHLRFMKISRRTLWISLILLCVMKCFYFFTFIVERNPETFSGFIVKGLALKGGDSGTYYDPLQNLFDNGDYWGICRMPGLAPVYLPLRVLFSHEQTQVVIIFIQLAGDILASFLCALLCFRLFKSITAYWTAIVFTAFSAFVLVRANYLLSDSFCNTSLILCAWFLHEWKHTKLVKHLLFSGVFLAWAIFLRQISITIIPSFVLLVMFFSERKLIRMIQWSFVFLIPLMLSISAWTIRNKVVFDRNIVLVAPINECMRQLTPEFLAMRKLLITMGQDAQPWAKGGALHWIMDREETYSCPIAERHLSGTVTRDSMEVMKVDYWRLQSTDSIDVSEQNEFVTRCERFESVYKKDHWFLHQVVNRIDFLYQFLFPPRLDDIPTKSFQEANIIVKMIKLGNYLLLLIVHALMLLSLLLQLWRKEFEILLWSSVGFVPIFILAYLGYIEQRYLATSHYFFILAIGYLAAFAARKFKKEPAID